MFNEGDDYWIDIVGIGDYLVVCSALIFDIFIIL
jgi:hypothetical protein